MLFKQEKAFLKRGFSLIELLISVSIFIIITSVVLAKYQGFNGGVVLTNLAYDIALSIRQAQVYGISVRESATGSSNFGLRYGIHFDSGNPTSFILFIDTNSNDKYDNGELIETNSIRQDNAISDFCGITSAGGNQCWKNSTVTSLDITFLRPNPDALINTNIGGNYRSATITVSSPRGTSRTVRVENTGQISVF